MPTSPQDTRPVVLVLRVGALLSFSLILLGLVLAALNRPGGGLTLMSLGLVVLLATPAVRVLTAALMFLRAGERRYAVVSLLVLAVVMTTWALSVLRS
jgi:uncharacterized membrane protein